MMSERQANAVAQFAHRQAPACRKVEGSLAFDVELVGIEFAELANQTALAMEVDGVTTFLALQPVDAHGGAAAGFLCQVAGLPPLERLCELADARCGAPPRRTSSRAASSSRTAQEADRP